MIKLNNTEARQKVKPLTPKQLEFVVKYLNDVKQYSQVKLSKEGEPTTQRLIDSYQNLQHFWDFVGGWEGLERIKENEYEEGYEYGRRIAINNH